MLDNVFGDVWIYDVEDDSWEQAVLGCASAGILSLLRALSARTARSQLRVAQWPGDLTAGATQSCFSAQPTRPHGMGSAQRNCCCTRDTG